MTARSSVWLVAQRPSREQRRNRYLPDSTRHPGKMLPALARQAITAFTVPGDVVVDPMCGIGTTLVEAAHLGRDSVGIEYEPRWATLAQANLALARAAGASGVGEVVVGDCRNLLSLLPAELVGQVALVLTSPPYGSVTHGHVRHDGTRIWKTNTRYSSDRENLAYTGQASLLGAMATMLRAASRVLTPDGAVVLTARPWRRDGALVDLPGALVEVANRAGLRLIERDVALLAALRDGKLVPRASFFQLKGVRAARARGVPQHVIAHEDVLAFGRQP
ncbi:MAG TPA: DNA methyltransferase [Acidimicrobiales bacterium]|nr:DNA methyltransferase [Acidimicrobiales bacterium]